MAQALAELDKAELSGATSQAYLDWSPNGKWLATLFIPSAPTSKSSDYQVVLYDCDTGARITALLPHMRLDLTMDGSQPALSWSPNGKHILLLDAYLGTMTIWTTPAAVQR